MRGAAGITIVRLAVDRRINFLDNSWAYNKRASETRMGKALRDWSRDKVYLMTKIDWWTKPKAARRLALSASQGQSLRSTTG